VSAVGNDCQLDAGDYWLVHSAEFALDDTAESYPWIGGPDVGMPLTTSRLELRPGSIAVLRDGWGEPVCKFRPAERPFIDLPGQRVSDADGECIHYGWTRHGGVPLSRGIGATVYRSVSRATRRVARPRCPNSPPSSRHRHAISAICPALAAGHRELLRETRL
jgi:hypothetical protein